MTTSLAFFFASDIAALIFLWRYIRPTMSLTSTAMGLLLLFHGPAYVYYTRRWAWGEGVAFNLYNNAWPQGISADGLDSAVSAANAINYELSNNFYTRMTVAVHNPQIVNAMDFALGLTMIFFCVGVWLADKIFKHGPAAHEEALRRWKVTTFLPLKHDVSHRILIVSGAAILFMLYFMVHDAQLSKVYTYFATHVGEFEKIAMRREMGGSKTYAFNLMLGTLLPFIAFCLWTWWREGSQSGVRWIAAAVIILIITAKLATLSKAPAAVFLLQLLVLDMVRRSLQVSLRHLAMFVCGGIALFSIMTFVANSDLGGASQSLLFLFYRIFMIPNESLLEYFAAFPSQLSHTYGHDIRGLAALLGAEPLSPSYLRVAELHRGAPGSATTAMFMADAWAAFSWPGVVAVSLMFGLLLRWIDIQLIVKRGRSCITIAGIGLGHYGIFIALSTAFQTSLLTGGLFLIVPMVTLLEWRWPWRTSRYSAST